MVCSLLLSCRWFPPVVQGSYLRHMDVPRPGGGRQEGGTHHEAVLRAEIRCSRRAGGEQQEQVREHGREKPRKRAFDYACIILDGRAVCATIVLPVEQQRLATGSSIESCLARLQFPGQSAYNEMSFN